jgi:CHAT domain-containing protein/tetratricopeptide (TPR) repeat protein
MTAAIVRVSLLAAAAALAGCAQEPERATATSADGCRQIEALYITAQRSSFSLDFPEAERKFREIAARYDDDPALRACRGAASEPLTYGELGLALSSQRKVRLAQAAFEDADAAVARMEADGASEEQIATQRGRLAALKAQNDLNTRDFAGAERESAVAINLLDTDSGASAVEPTSVLGLSADEQSRRLSGVTGLYSRSAALARLGDRIEDARAANEQALRIASSIPGATGALQSRILIDRAKLEIRAGRDEAAVETASRAAAQLAEELPETPLAANARLVEGAALANVGRRDAAFAAFRSAFDTYANFPAALSYEAVWPYIKLAVESEAAGAIDEATMAAGIFEAAQLVRSANAASDIAQTVAEFAETDSAAAAAVRDWRAAQDELFLISSALSRRDLEEFERESLNRRFIEAAAAEERLRDRRDAVAPEFASAIERPATLAAVQDSLGEDEALIQILVGVPRSTVILVEPDAVTVRTPAFDAPNTEAIVSFLRSSTVAVGGGYGGYEASIAYEVFRGLLLDLGPRVAETAKVFVATNGAMQSLPLEILVASNPAGEAGALARGDYRGVDWLGLRTLFSYLPSVRSLVDLRAAPGSASASDVVAFGDYNPGADAAAGVSPRLQAVCGGEVETLRRLPRLAGTRAELESIDAAFAGAGVDTFLGDAFTEGRVKALSEEGRLADYRVVHFATHGMLWPTVDCFDPLLTASVAPEEGEDGLLQSGELRRLDLDAQLVVLSACQSTGVEVADAGENLSGLARAFFGAGARSVIASHWLVEDEAAAAIMSAFYQQLAADRSIAFGDALRNAREVVRTRPETSHPAFWAPFVLVGDGRLSLSADG